MFEIGEKVTWNVGKFCMIGCILEELQNDKYSIITHSKNGLRCNQLVEINKKLLKKHGI